MVEPFGFVVQEPYVENFTRCLKSLSQMPREDFKKHREKTIKYAQQNFNRKNAEVFLRSL
jgi:hypothetical protein